MSTDTSPAGKALASGIRTALGLSGVIALIVGVLILVLPGKTALVVTAIVAIYAIAGGLVYLGLGIFSRSMGGWARVGHLVLGVLFVVAGVTAFVNLAQTALWLAAFVGILVGIMWIVEGMVALTTLGRTRAKGSTLLFAALSIAAGIILLFSPLWGALVLWWLLGVSLVVLGVMQIVRALTFNAKNV